MNLNEWAKRIAKLETGKKQVSIAQIKEIMRLMAVDHYNNMNIRKRFLSLGKRHSPLPPPLPDFLKNNQSNDPSY